MQMNDSRRKVGQFMELRFVFSLLFAILVALFAILNSGIVTINFLFAAFPVSQALVILISATTGAIIAMLLGAVKQFKLQRKIKEQVKNIEQLQGELAKITEQKEIPIIIETPEVKPVEDSDEQQDSFDK